MRGWAEVVLSTLGLDSLVARVTVPITGGLGGLSSLSWIDGCFNLDSEKVSTFVSSSVATDEARWTRGRNGTSHKTSSDESSGRQGPLAPVSESNIEMRGNPPTLLRPSVRQASWLRVYRTYNHRRNARNGAGQPASERLFSRARVDFLDDFLFLFFFTPLLSCPYYRLVLDNKNPPSCDTRRKRHMRSDHVLPALISPPFSFPFLCLISRSRITLTHTKALPGENRTLSFYPVCA